MGKGYRYNGMSTEVGPSGCSLACLIISVKEVVGLVLSKLGVGPAALFSTLGRTAARGIETLVTAEMLPVWIDDLAAKIKRRCPHP
jgi:Ni,Fe-hydrogenase I large subunit